MIGEDFKRLVDWLVKDLPSSTQPPPSRGTLLRWEQIKKDRQNGEYQFDPANITISQQKQFKRDRELWLLELETDASDMEAAGNEGWPDNFIAPMGLKTDVVKEILSADGWTPLKGKMRTIRELRGEKV